MPHETLGEQVALAVAPKHGYQAQEITLETLQPYTEQLAPFQRPTLIFYYDHELPKGITGKILKREIKQNAMVHMQSQ